MLFRGFFFLVIDDWMRCGYLIFDELIRFFFIGIGVRRYRIFIDEFVVDCLEFGIYF